MMKGYGGMIKHGQTVFMDNPGQHWDWNNGFLRFFGSMGDTADLLVCYEQKLIQKRLDAKFCYQ